MGQCQERKLVFLKVLVPRKGTGRPRSLRNSKSRPVKRWGPEPSAAVLYVGWDGEVEGGGRGRKPMAEETQEMKTNPRGVTALLQNKAGTNPSPRDAALAGPLSRLYSKTRLLYEHH